MADPLVIGAGYTFTGLVDIYGRAIVRPKDPIGFVSFSRDKYKVIFIEE